MSKALVVISVALYSGLHARSEQLISSQGFSNGVTEDAAPTILAKAAHLPVAAKDLGQVPAATNIRRIQLVLKRAPEQDNELGLLLQQQQDPSSENYHRWLTPTEFGERFGPAQSKIDELIAWLNAQGFQAVHVNAGRTVMEISGPASAIQLAFKTSLHAVSLATGTYYANLTAPLVPQAFRSLVVGVRSLNNLPRSNLPEPQTYRQDKKTGLMTRLHTPPASSTSVKPQFTYSSNGATTMYGLGPYDFATIYNVLPLWNAPSPIDGMGESIAVVGDSFINPADFVNFRKLFTLPLGDTNTQTGTQYFNVIYNGTPPQSTTNEFHADADTQWSAAVAKNSTIIYVASETTEISSGMDLSAQYIVDNNLAAVLVDTYTSCELELGSSGNAFYNSLWRQAAAQGISVVTSSGNSGNAACDVPEGPPATHGRAVNGVASTPYAVAVGGTQFYTSNGISEYFSPTNTSKRASAKGYIPESIWNDSCTDPTAISEDSVTNITAERTCNSSMAMANGLDIVAGGGGGPSSCIKSDGSSAASCSGGYGKPSWQNIPGVPADGARDLPDISFFASKGGEGSSYLVCDQDPATFSAASAITPPNAAAAISVPPSAWMS